MKVLIILSVPKNSDKLPYAKEERDKMLKVIKSKLGSNKVTIDELSTESESAESKPTMKNIINKLRQGRYNIIHYIGHSKFDRNKGIGKIYLVDDRGDAKAYDDDDFANRLDPQRTTNLALIVLNSCQSGVERGFNGLAKRIIEKKTIPCVISMQFKILDRSGPEFASKFYEEFIESNYAPEDAVSFSRENLLQVDFGPTKEFIAPVVYMAARQKSILRGIEANASKKQKLQDFQLCVVL